jgi:ADP-L-glycero-D-manno-heptose 6-epimerase
MIAITGAAGFIGSNLAHRLAGMGFDLMLVDRSLSPSKVLNWIGLDRFEYATGNAFVNALRNDDLELDAVFHLGACSSTTETDWNFLRENNITFSQEIWTWCAKSHCPFYYASSAATYGDGSQGFDDRLPPEKLRPLNLYGKSKNDFDHWVLAQVDGGNPAPPAWAGLKFFNVFGPRERHKGKMASVVWHARRQIEEVGEVSLFKSNDPAIGDGGQRRDFVFVEDCIDHALWLWEHPAVTGIFNSGTGTARSFEDLARAVFSATHREPRIRFIDMPAELSKQYQNFTRADMTKLTDAGYAKPATTLEDGVRQAIAKEAQIVLLEE